MLSAWTRKIWVHAKFTFFSDAKSMLHKSGTTGPRQQEEVNDLDLVANLHEVGYSMSLLSSPLPTVLETAPLLKPNQAAPLGLFRHFATII